MAFSKPGSTKHNILDLSEEEIILQNEKQLEESKQAACDELSSKRCNSTRKDVVHQAIFRNMRKFYMQMFQRFYKVKGKEIEGGSHLKQFAAYMTQSMKGKQIQLHDMMLHVGSIIYPSNVQQLEERIFSQGPKKEQGKARFKAALSILKYREIVEKFNIEKMKAFLKDPIYQDLFKIYSSAVLSGKFQMTEVMQKNTDVYKEAFKEIYESINA
jgi:hypothetical protein